MDCPQLHHTDIIDTESEVHYAFYHPQRETTGRHCHDFYEIFLVVQGNLVHCFNGTRQKLGKGSLVFIRPGDTHHYERADTGDCQFINLAFVPAALDSLLQYLGAGFRPERLLSCPEPPVAVLSPQDTDALQKRLESIHLIPMSEKGDIRTQLRILLAHIFTNYYPVALYQPETQLPDWLDALYLDMQKAENFCEGVKRMQELSGKSHEHICRVFRRFYGKSPTLFVNELRLNYAASLLTFTDGDILSISQNTGFENLSHFYHLFRKRYGQPPSRFRQLHRKTLIP